LFDTPIETGRFILLCAALLIACGFEFVNGFHDTANAVATVIYTHSLKPSIAVMWSGFCNFMGVALGGIAVAMSIIKLLPVELLASSGSGAGLSMVLALLLAAITWNLGTWYFGLPSSSSHTLIGAIVGVGLANSLMPGHVFGTGVNWHKVQEIGLALILSPLLGLGLAYGTLILARKYLKSKELHTPPDGKTPPPTWIRALLIGTCTGVSYAHGSNDGQKGVGLIMLILIGLLPADFALNSAYHKTQFEEAIACTHRIDAIARTALESELKVASAAPIAIGDSPAAKVISDLVDIREAFSGKDDVKSIPPEKRFSIRMQIMRVDSSLGDLEKKGKLSADQVAALKKERSALRGAIDYAPSWVLVVIALSLGVGTMVGWKRIVVTVGEKIGKAHLTYAQGGAAEAVAMTTIGLGGWLGLPVSTTHVLSSGIAGTMVAQKSGLQSSTVRNIALAWVLTLPASILLAGALFLGFRAIIPDANAATTPAVKFTDPSAEQATVAVPVLGRPLRLHGSNTIGAELAPALAESFLRHEGGQDVQRQKDVGGHAWIVTAKLPGEMKPVAIEIDAAGSGTGFADLLGHTADLAMSSRPVTADEVKKAQAAGLGDLTAPGNENVIGLDGIAIVVNSNNQAHAMSMDEVAAVFTGKTGNWPSGGPVTVFARDDKSGTFDTFKSIVLADRAIAPSARRFQDSVQLAEAVRADEGAIGFIAMPYARNVRSIALSEAGASAILPTPFTVATEDYPLTRRLYLYAPASSEHPLARDFISFTLSNEGQGIVSTSGFVDLAAKAKSDANDACTNCPPEYAALSKDAKRLSINFRFMPGSTVLDSRGMVDMKRLVSMLVSMRSPNVILVGFSDSAGPPEENVKLSKTRASRVSAALELNGIHTKDVLGLGATMPVASDSTPEGRERNRRVEVWIKP
jgi:PiT family inorganic phosphate transporter